jgi:hypothetical protein
MSQYLFKPSFHNFLINRSWLTVGGVVVVFVGVGVWCVWGVGLWCLGV